MDLEVPRTILTVLILGTIGFLGWMIFSKVSYEAEHPCLEGHIEMQNRLNAALYASTKILVNTPQETFVCDKRK